MKVVELGSSFRLPVLVRDGDEWMPCNLARVGKEEMADRRYPTEI